MDQRARIHLSSFGYLHFQLQFGGLISSQQPWQRGTDQHRRKARAIEELCEQGSPG